MKNLKPSKLFTLLVLTAIVAVLGFISKSEKRNSEQSKLAKGIFPSALADVPGGSATASTTSEGAEASTAESCEGGTCG